MVSVICTVYNHERYLKQALEGILMQKTNFAFEVLIHDDASTDNSAAIIKEYEQKYQTIIRAIYQTENQYSKNVKIADTYIFPIARGKYFAMCECDDYWTDSNKLQMQVDYLERNPNCMLTAHAGRLCYENGIIMQDVFRPYMKECVVSKEDLMSKWLFPTASLVYRKELRKAPIPFIGDSPCGDVPTVLYAASKGTVYYFDKYMCVYRKGAVSSVTNSWDKNPNQAIGVNNRFIEMLNRYDIYTDYKYTSYIDKFRINKEFSNLLLKRDYNSICKDRYREYYSNASFLTKIKVMMRCFFPTFSNYLISINEKNI